MKLRNRRHGYTRATLSMRLRERRVHVEAELRASNRAREQVLFATLAAQRAEGAR